MLVAFGRATRRFLVAIDGLGDLLVERVLNDLLDRLSLVPHLQSQLLHLQPCLPFCENKLILLNYLIFQYLVTSLVSTYILYVTSTFSVG